MQIQFITANCHSLQHFLFFFIAHVEPNLVLKSKQNLRALLTNKLLKSMFKSGKYVSCYKLESNQLRRPFAFTTSLIQFLTKDQILTTETTVSNNRSKQIIFLLKPVSKYIF